MKEIFTLPLTDPHLLEEGFQKVMQKEALSLQQEAALSLLFDLSGLLDSAKWRALKRARDLSDKLFSSKGEIDEAALKNQLLLLEAQGWHFYPSRSDPFPTHAIRFLTQLQGEEIQRLIKQFHSPLCHSWAEKLVRHTLGLPATTVLTDLLVRKAAVCACLTPLRQNVGSCFATAPAILIQQDTPELLLHDLYQMLTTGKLKRTFGGVEYALPLSPSTGVGDTRKNLTIQAALCPGLLAACELLGYSSTEQLQALIVAERKNITVEAFLQALCLKVTSLTEQDLQRGAEWEKEQVYQFKSGALGSSSLSKLKEIQHFREQRLEALETFKGMSDNALLKAWEFTLASFSEVKMEFAAWNFYTSLGFSSHEEGGIGELLFNRINEKVEEINKKLKKKQEDYQIAFDQLRAVESLLRNVSSEAEARRLKAEYQSRAYHLRSCQELRDDLFEKGSRYASLFPFLLKQYEQKCPEYFQEIYDAQMQDVQVDAYEDSPAGFRLVYKHGRLDPASWTLISNKEEYIHCLADFFSLTMPAILMACEWEEGESEIRDLTAQLLQHIRTPRFLETALKRMVVAHQTLLPQTTPRAFSAAEKKPWGYTSGGTMTTLLKTYYCRTAEFTSESKWVESPQELLVFILDSLKALSLRLLDPYLKRLRTGMLMQSPTHAFSLLPDLIKQGWQSSEFTYTWVRDEIISPSQGFYASMRLTREEQLFLFDQIAPLSKHNPFPSVDSLSVVQWRDRAAACFLPADVRDQIDAFLYQSLPLIPGGKSKELLLEFLSRLSCSAKPEWVQQLLEAPPVFFTARQFHNLVKSCYLVLEEHLCFSFDLQEQVARIARELGTASPTPLLFADTNWESEYFAFLVNPGTGQLDLWRTDKALSSGMPMSQWREWLSGKQRHPWTLFTHSYEYL